MRLSGVYTAMITPFLKNFEVDYEGFRQNLRFQINSGVDGVVILGTTGETPTLIFEEKKKLIAIAVEEIQKKIHLLVGTGSNCTIETIKQTILAQELGADGALIVTPYYNKPTQEGIFQHFQAICQSTDFPICLYNVPGRTCQNLELKTLQRLASFDNIMAIKEASGRLSQMEDILQWLNETNHPLTILSGDDALTFPLMALGGHGVISVISNLIPQAVCQLVTAIEEGLYEEARELHFQLLPLCKAAFIETNPIPIKALMNDSQMAAGPCRLPLCPLDTTFQPHLNDILQTIPSSWFGHYGYTQSTLC